MGNPLRRYLSVVKTKEGERYKLERKRGRAMR